MARQIVDLELILHHETAGAILVSLDGERAGAVWLPKSAIEYEHKTPRVILAQVPVTLATDKGLT